MNKRRRFKAKTRRRTAALRRRTPRRIVVTYVGDGQRERFIPFPTLARAWVFERLARDLDTPEGQS